MFNDKIKTDTEILYRHCDVTALSEDFKSQVLS